MRLSRRIVLKALPAAPLAAQVPAESDPDLETARQALASSVGAVRQIELPMWVEPATKFVPRG
jgi:hypothetical protein